MSSTKRRTVFLKDARRNAYIRALVFSPIPERHFSFYYEAWRPYNRGTEHSLWNWPTLYHRNRGKSYYAWFAIEHDERPQGFLAVNITRGQKSRVPSQRGQDILFVELLEVAPWNRREAGKFRKFFGVGYALVACAVTKSIEIGCEGRIGLHALRPSEAFYREGCGMEDLGQDRQRDHLRYFEMTTAQAGRFLE